MMTDTLSTRERFAAVLFNGPMLRSDAIVVLCGEDGDHRADVGLHLLQTQHAPVLLLTGGLESAGKRSAQKLRTSLIGKGVSPDRLLVDERALHTRDQAVNTVALAVEKGWRRLLLIASGYHMARAYLTFVRALTEAGQAETIRVIPVTASQLSWFASPDGVSASRLDLLTGEAEKVERYTAHVATYGEGLDYLAHWEGR